MPAKLTPSAQAADIDVTLLKNTSATHPVQLPHLVDELHKKIASWLVDTFDIILLPTFDTSQMTCKAHRKLRKKSVRQMLTLSHYRFKRFLKQKAKETGAIVVDVCEAYTSKTVSWTGDIVQNLGGRKTIKDTFGLSMDRALNGARGIFLRALVDKPGLLRLSNLQTMHAAHSFGSHGNV